MAGQKWSSMAIQKMSLKKKALQIRAAAAALRNHETYIFGPDMGTNEQCMAWVRDENGRAVGLPRELGGIPLDEIGAIGWGLRHATEVAMRQQNFELHTARIVIQGFGSVGKHAARYLTELATAGRLVCHFQQSCTDGRNRQCCKQQRPSKSLLPSA